MYTKQQVFFVLTTLNGGRCSSATLTEVKLSQNGKDAAATIDFRLRLVSDEELPASILTERREFVIQHRQVGCGHSVYS